MAQDHGVARARHGTAHGPGELVGRAGWGMGGPHVLLQPLAHGRGVEGRQSLDEQGAELVPRLVEALGRLVGQRTGRQRPPEGVVLLGEQVGELAQDVAPGERQDPDGEVERRFAARPGPVAETPRQVEAVPRLEHAVPHRFAESGRGRAAPATVGEVVGGGVHRPLLGALDLEHEHVVGVVVEVEPLGIGG